MNKTAAIEHKRLKEECRRRGWHPLYFSLRRVNAVSKRAFRHLMPPDAICEAGGMTGYLEYLAPIYKAIRTLAKFPPDPDGIRKGNYNDRELWLVPNRLGTLTMICPEDYRAERCAASARASGSGTQNELLTALLAAGTPRYGKP